MSKAQIVWSNSARQELYDLLVPLRDSAPKRADKLADKLIKTVQRLADFPESGRKPPDLLAHPEVREVIVEQFRIFYIYREANGIAGIIAIFNSRQDVASQFEARFDDEFN